MCFGADIRTVGNGEGLILYMPPVQTIWGRHPKFACNLLFLYRQQGLLQLLKAYTVYRPQEGYCQAQGPLAALLLMHMPPEVSHANIKEHSLSPQVTLLTPLP